MRILRTLFILSFLALITIGWVSILSRFSP